MEGKFRPDDRLGRGRRWFEETLVETIYVGVEKLTEDERWL